MATSPPTPSPRVRNPRGQGERLRVALLDAAIDLLGELGDVEALSVRAVTARAGVTPTALYLHFCDKQELLDAVKERCFAELRRYVLAAEERAAPDPRAQAEAMCLAYLKFAGERPGHYRVLFQSRHDSAPADSEASTSDAYWPPQGAEAFGDLVRGAQRCLDPERDAFETATLVWAGLHGYAGLRTMRHFPFPPPEQYVTLLLEAHLGTA